LKTGGYQWQNLWWTRDVRSIKDDIIWCRGKEREEYAPILMETQCLLGEISRGLSDDDLVIRSNRVRAGGTQPLGETGLRLLIQRVLGRAGIKKTGHDLRRTFRTIVSDASGDELLAMRLLRDIIPE
jgi:integrase